MGPSIGQEAHPIPRSYRVLSIIGHRHLGASLVAYIMISPRSRSRDPVYELMPNARALHGECAVHCIACSPSRLLGGRGQARHEDPWGRTPKRRTPQSRHGTIETLLPVTALVAASRFEGRHSRRGTATTHMAPRNARGPAQPAHCPHAKLSIGALCGPPSLGPPPCAAGLRHGPNNEQMRERTH